MTVVQNKTIGGVFGGQLAKEMGRWIGQRGQAIRIFGHDALDDNKPVRWER